MRSRFSTVLLVLCAARLTLAQRVVENTGHIFYEDPNGARTNLGIGFSPVFTTDGRIAFIGGREFYYGETLGCDDKATRNRVMLYNPASRSELVLFDKGIRFDGLKFCVFEQMQLSPDRSILYLVASVYATAGSLAMIRLASGAIRYVPGVCRVYVIESGPHQGDLIYTRRMWWKGRLPGDEHPYYPFVHAGADGKPIRVLAEEELNGGVRDAPRLRNYLRQIEGSIHIDGVLLP